MIGLVQCFETILPESSLGIPQAQIQRIVPNSKIHTNNCCNGIHCLPLNFQMRAALCLREVSVSQYPEKPVMY